MSSRLYLGPVWCCSVRQNFAGCFTYGVCTSLASSQASPLCLELSGTVDKNRFLGPNVLKVTACMTPLLLLLLLNTAKDAKEYKEVVSKLSYQMAVDLFDAVEMLDIVLDEKEHNYGIPKGFGLSMIVLACISFLLSPWQMAENNLEKGKLRKRTAI